MDYYPTKKLDFPITVYYTQLMAVNSIDVIYGELLTPRTDTLSFIWIHATQSIQIQIQLKFFYFSCILYTKHV